MKEKAALQKRIHTELNLEKWSIWQPTYTNNNPKRRILERPLSLDDGSKIIARVEVGFSDLGVLTTEDQKVYYALIKIWEEDDRPPIPYFSLQRLAKVLHKPWSGRTAKSLSQSLERLQATPFAWIDSYYDSTTKKNITIKESFNILTNLKLVTNKAGKHTTKQECCCKFNDLIENNLRNNHTKPLLFETIIQFTSGITQLLYRFVDLMMADKPHYERRTELLFQDLQLQGESYKKPSVRKHILEKSLKELNGCPISTGILKATITQTEDRKDYKVIFDKVAKPKSIDVKATAIPSQEKTKKAPSQPKSETQKVDPSPAQDLVKYFYKLFHSLDSPYPTEKEINQALGLIKRYGFDLAKYVVEFSHTAAAKTDYQPETFSGIVHYAPRAADEFAKKQKLQEAQLQKQAEQQTQQQLQQQRDEEAATQLAAHLRSILANQFDSFEQQVKQQLFNKTPWLEKIQHMPMFKLELYQEMLYQLKQQGQQS